MDLVCLLLYNSFQPADKCILHLEGKKMLYILSKLADTVKLVFNCHSSLTKEKVKSIHSQICIKLSRYGDQRESEVNSQGDVFTWIAQWHEPWMYGHDVCKRKHLIWVSGHKLMLVVLDLLSEANNVNNSCHPHPYTTVIKLHVFFVFFSE